MNLLTEATIFAAKAHEGAKRRGTQIPYIVHPMETAAIAAGLTCDEEVIAAALLHDVIEDCGVTREELAARFGERVAALVQAETQQAAGDPGKTWGVRKLAAVVRMRTGSPESRIIALADKLSNMRAITRDYRDFGENMFRRFHQQDRRLHAWYYRSCLEAFAPELGETTAFREMAQLVQWVFVEVESVKPEELRESAD